MNTSSTVNRIAADSTARCGASSPRRRKKMLPAQNDSAGTP